MDGGGLTAESPRDRVHVRTVYRDARSIASNETEPPIHPFPPLLSSSFALVPSSASYCPLNLSSFALSPLLFPSF